MPCSDCSPTFTILEKLKECKLLSRARCNQAPVASERTELRELVSRAENELVRYDDTIARLHDIIIALENEKKNLDRQVQLANSLMAPIRNLPPEILRQIFIAHGVGNVIHCDYSKPDIPGYKVASICSHWHSIATDTTALWNDITLVVPEEAPCFSPEDLSLARYLLSLSVRSHLSITLDFQSTRGEITAVPILRSLCEHANRWQSLQGSCRNDSTVMDTLSSVKGRLDNLHTFQFRAPFEICSALVEGAPKLHTLTLQNDIDTASTAIPWNQIVHFELRVSPLSSIVQSLAVLPNLRSLTVFLDCDVDPTPSPGEQPVHSDLNNLEIVIEDSESDEVGMLDAGISRLFDVLFLPRLHTLSITSLEAWETKQDVLGWWSSELPSLISRSSTLLTSFSLENVWFPVGDLISLLQQMPVLTSLSVLESSSDALSMLDDQFLMRIHCHQNRQPLLTRLTTLTLELQKLSTRFSVPVFVEVIHSRWKPSSVVEDEVACIKNVTLRVWKDRIAGPVARSLGVLRKRGLNIAMTDMDGDVFSRC